MLAEFNLHYFIASMTSEEDTIHYSEEEKEVGRMPSPPPAPPQPPGEGRRQRRHRCRGNNRGAHWCPPARGGEDHHHPHLLEGEIG